jgi:DUF971 family protein
VDDATSPETIDVRRDEGVTITFLDGGVADFDLVTLRQGCPCAACRNKRDQGLDAWPLPNSPQPLRIEDARLHGAWALAFTWNDGHATGVYPFESLRRWSEGGAAFGPDSGLAGATDGPPPGRDDPPSPGDGSPGGSGV